MERSAAGARKCGGWRCCVCAVFWLAAASIGIGVAVPVFLQNMVQSGLDGARVVDSPKASGYEHFLNYSYESDNRFVVTFFNISNWDQMLKTENVSPKLEEIGPFVYETKRTRVVDHFDVGGSEVTYHQHTWQEFLPEETMKATNGQYDCDDCVKISTLNLLFNGMRLQVGRRWWHTISDLLLWKEDEDRLFEHRTPKELLQGYSVDIELPGGIKLPLAFPGLYPNLDVKKDPDYQKRSTIKTGSDTPEDTFKFVSWREQTSVKVKCPYAEIGLPLDEQCQTPRAKYPCCGGLLPVPVWDTAKAVGEFDEDANAVQGTAGDQFAPGLHKDHEMVVVWFDLAQRAMAMTADPKEGLSDYKGASVRRFRPDRNLVWGNVHERPANARFYQWGPGGLMNLTMLFGADIYVSLPHFMNCDPKLRTDVEGLKPEKELHDLYISVEPNSGITLEEQERAMVSVQVRAEPALAPLDKGYFSKLGDRTLYVPVAWFNVQALATQGAVDQLKMMYLAKAMTTISRYLGLGLGVVTFMLAVRLSICCKRNGRVKPNAPLLPEAVVVDT